MKRFYLSKIKAVQDPQFGTVYKHRLQELSQTMPIDYVGGEIATNAQGVATEKAVLVLVSGVDHKRLQNDAELVPMPVIAHDVKVGAIHTPTKLKAKAAVKALGFSDAEMAAAWDNADGFRDVLEHYGKKNNPAFDCDKFDISED